MSHPVPEVTVVIPTYNRPASTLRALESVRNQSVSNLEIIVVDDGSEDETLQQLSAVEDPRVVIMHHETNRGAAAARNTGIRAARAPLVAFQDSDDHWEPDKLEQQLAHLERNPDADVIYCTILRTWDAKTSPIPAASQPNKAPDISREILLQNYIGTPSILAKKAALDSIDGFDESLPCLEDWDLNIRLSQGHSYGFVDRPLVKATVQTNSISRNIEAACQALDRIHDKHGELFRTYPVANAKFYARRGHYACLKGDLAAGRRLLQRSLKEGAIYLPAPFLLMLSYGGAALYRRMVNFKTPTSSGAPKQEAREH